MWKAHPVFVVSFSMLTATSLPVQAVSPLLLSGTVNMQGAIIDTACAITMDRGDQTIELGPVSEDDLVRGASWRTFPFTLTFESCMLAGASATSSEFVPFRVMFEGQAEGDLFHLNGSLGGVALQITDDTGRAVRPGIALVPHGPPSDRLRIRYDFRLVSNHHPFKVGEYFTTLQLKMDYF